LWTPQPALDGVVRGTPSVVASPSGKLDVVANKDTSGALRSRTYDANTNTWTAWVDVPPPPGANHSNPAIVTSAIGRVDVFERGDATLYWNRREANGTWRGWSALGTGVGGASTLVGSPSAVSPGLGMLEVYIRAENNDIQRITCRKVNCTLNQWSQWETLGGSFASDPHVSVRGRGATIRTEVTALATNGQVMRRAGNGWATLAAPSVGLAPGAQPIAFMANVDRVDVFVRGADDNLYQHDGTGWKGLGRPDSGVASDATVVLRSGRTEFYVLGANGALFSRAIDPIYGLTQWELVSESGFSTKPTAVQVGPDRVDLFATTSAGVLVDLRRLADRAPANPPPPVIEPDPSWAIGAPAHPDTFRYRDVNGDGKADVCARSAYGMACALSTGTKFGPVTVWDTEFSDANGYGVSWRSASTQLADVNNDGRADVCGVADNGIRCALSNGSEFETASQWDTKITSALMSFAQNAATIRYGDVNGDGNTDVCGRASWLTWCVEGTGSAFQSGWFTLNPIFLGMPNPYSYLGEYPYSVALADVTGDGRADWCGRTATGMMCAASTVGSRYELGTGGGLPTGTTFALPTQWEHVFVDPAWGVNGQQYGATIRVADVDGDGRPDACGRWKTGVLCGTTRGTAMGAPLANATKWSAGNDYADPMNATQPLSWVTSMGLADVTGDGKVDVCQRQSGGVVCSVGTGTAFAATTQWDNTFLDVAGWQW
jgi:hypothetical protein